MDERTLTALQGSIKKWEEIAAGTGEDHGCSNCPLCKEFTLRSSEGSCAGCPVNEAGYPDCERTPYSEFWRMGIQQASPRSRTANTPELVEIAKREVDFLKSLLPEPPR